MPRVRRAAYFAAAPVVCLILFWRVPLTWFVNDDFAWLSLPLQLHRASDLLRILFAPQAQGTVRFLSERLFFLTFSSWFGLHALPYRILVLATWFGCLTLAALVGARIARSRAAGLLAAVLWTSSSVIVLPLAWASAYNQVLCAFCILAAFYSRLRWIESGRRRWRIAEWTAYLAGFGALEVIVMYPPIAALHALCFAPRKILRKRIASTIALFVPAALFGIFHLFLISRSVSPYYQVIVDRRLPETLLSYLQWSLGPSRLQHFYPNWGWFGTIATISIALALAVFAIWRLWHRDLAVLFCCGWFLLPIAPVLPLPNHVIDYYATVPALGLAWLGGWAIAAGWRAGWWNRALAVILAAAFLAGSYREIDAYTRWEYGRSVRMRALVLAARDAAGAHPGTALALRGIDDDLFQAGVQDGPFRLFGVSQVYLVPGSEKGIQARADLGGIGPFLIAPSRLQNLLQTGQARVIGMSGNSARDITVAYENLLSDRPKMPPRGFIDAGNPDDALLFGPEWFPIDGGARWMPKMATVRVPVPRHGSGKFSVTGFAPAALLASGPVTLHFSAAGRVIGDGVVDKPDRQFSFAFALPADLAGKGVFELTIEVNKTFRAPGDGRDLGMVFGTFAVH